MGKWGNESVKDQTRPPRQFGANPFSGFRDISYTNKKPQTDEKQNLPQFTACGKDKTDNRLACKWTIIIHLVTRS